MAHKKKAHSKESKKMAYEHEAEAGRKYNKSKEHREHESKAMKHKTARGK